MDSMAASIGISVFNIALTIVNVGVIRFWIRVSRRSGATMRWFYCRDALFDRLPTMCLDSRTLRADAPCGGVLLARVREKDLEQAVRGPEPEFGILFDALLVRCPFNRDGSKAFDCPLFDHAHDAAFGAAVETENPTAGRAESRAVELEWFPSVVPDCKLPPFAPLAVANKTDRKRCLRGLRQATVLHVPSAELKSDLGCDAEDGEGGEDERGGFHAAESTTDGDGRKAPAPDA